MVLLYFGKAPLSFFVADTVAFVHGPQGSGKSTMLSDTLDKMQRRALIVDVSELLKANSEVKLVSGLAQQTGYWPVFSFTNSLNNLVDMASQGLIGQKGRLVTICCLGLALTILLSQLA